MILDVMDCYSNIRGNLFVFSDFIRDGVYTLELTAVDVTGNRSLLNRNTYARMIQQDVLAYILDSNPTAKNGLFLIILVFCTRNSSTAY